MGRRLQRNRNDAGSLLAATFVVAMGGGCVLFAIFALTPEGTVWQAAAFCGAMLVLLLAIALVRFNRVPRIGLGFWSIRFRSHRNDSAVDGYLPRVRKPRPKKFGDNQPITAEQARELNRSSSSTWVPSRHAQDGSG